MAVGNTTMQRMLSERRAALGLPVRDLEESDPNRQQPNNPTDYFEDMFFITWFSSSTHLQVFQIWKTSGLEDFWVRRLPDDFQTTSRKSSRRLPGSLLTESSPMSLFHNRSERFGSLPDDFKEVFQTTSKKSSRRLQRSLPDDFKEVFQTTSKKSSRRLQRSLPDDFKEVFQTTSKKSSRRLQRSLPDDFKEVFQTTSKKSSRRRGWHMRFFITWFSSSTHLHVFQIWKTSGLEDFQTTSRKSSRRLPGSLLTESSPMSLFHNRSEHFGFSDLSLIYIFFKSGTDFGRLMGSLLGSLLKYNTLEDFQEAFQTTSKKSSRRLQRSLPDDFKEVFQTTSKKSSRRLQRSLPDDFKEVFQTTSKKSSRRLPGSLLTGRLPRRSPGRLLGSRPFRRLPGSLPDDFKEVFQTTSKKSSRKSSDGVFFHILPYQMEFKLVFVEQ
ncbi:hypothetical protein F2Q69_00055981 [Brassica cretica]|uniref:Uncharacterized protein n=1 Tax=Brassica cretica TaxID=69181 RepID=A0A8S9MQD2_BRACR|nr:hypothetical protein F2Q69_00055981 [Brassica cretica]